MKAFYTAILMTLLLTISIETARVYAPPLEDLPSGEEVENVSPMGEDDNVMGSLLLSNLWLQQSGETGDVPAPSESPGSGVVNPVPAPSESPGSGIVNPGPAPSESPGSGTGSEDPQPSDPEAGEPGADESSAQISGGAIELSVILAILFAVLVM
eukprot:419944_1